MNKAFKISYGIVFSSLFLLGCRSDKPFIPDTSSINLEVGMIPFHEEIIPDDPNQVKDHIRMLFEKYPYFSRLFFHIVFPIDSDENIETAELLFDKGFQNLVDTCTLVFEDLNDIKADLTSAFKNYVYYTYDYEIPNVYTFVSGFSYQTFVFQDGAKDGIGIGLDMFLGLDFPYKHIDPNNPSFSEYLSYFFDKKYLVRKTLFTWVDDKIPLSKSSKLLDIIVRNGKILFILENILPESGKDVVLEYRPDEYEWCLQNEVALWSHLLKENLLYESDFKKINKLVNASPGAQGIPKEAPGGVANYIGWRIVQKYMERSQSTMIDLISNDNAQEILDVSMYKPVNRG